MDAETARLIYATKQKIISLDDQLLAMLDAYLKVVVKRRRKFDKRINDIKKQRSKVLETRRKMKASVR